MIEFCLFFFFCFFFPQILNLILNFNFFCSLSQNRPAARMSTPYIWSSCALSVGPWMSANTLAGRDTQAHRGRSRTSLMMVFPPSRSKSTKINPLSDDVFPANTGGSLYDGRKQVLYWADVSSEVAFVVPSPDFPLPISRRSSVGAMSGDLFGAHFTR